MSSTKRFYTAFGETKSLKEWLIDSRNVHNLKADTLRRRVDRQCLTMEEALLKPSRFDDKASLVKIAKKEGISYSTLYYRKSVCGCSVEEALKRKRHVNHSGRSREISYQIILPDGSVESLRTAVKCTKWNPKQYSYQKIRAAFQAQKIPKKIPMEHELVTV